MVRIELTTYALRKHCSTTELHRRTAVLRETGNVCRVAAHFVKRVLLPDGICLEAVEEREHLFLLLRADLQLVERGL